MKKFNVTYSNAANTYNRIIVLAKTRQDAMKNVNSRHPNNKAFSAVCCD